MLGAKGHYCLWLLLALSLPTWAQTQDSSAAKKIRIVQALKGYYDKAQAKNRLIGEVIFEHEGALMYCDSAWLYSGENRLEAFENVYLNQGDTLELWGDYLEYSGESRQALVRGKEVKLRDPEMTLRTDRLRLDRNNDIAYYNSGGEIINEDNRLTSRQGAYHSRTKFFYFKDSVVLVNPEYTMYSDTLDYQSESHIAYFRGPSRIVNDSNSSIYCENGRYNTTTNIAQFARNAKLYDGHQYLSGDSLYYEKERDYGEAYCFVVLHDTLENYLIQGDYGEYHGAADSAFVTEEPWYTLVDEEQDSLYLRGDTIFSAQRQDSLGQDYRLIRSFSGVRFWRRDLQGRADSMSYSSADSIMRLFHDPVLWDDSTQVTGDTIYLQIRAGQPDTLLVFKNAFMLSLVDSSGRYNQVSGKLMIGKFGRKQLRKLYVNGNGQTRYYPREDDGSYIGLNASVCSNIMIHFDQGQVSRISFLKKPEGTLFPMDKIPADKLYLEGFKPRFDERPTGLSDLFFPHAATARP